MLRRIQLPCLAGLLVALSTAAAQGHPHEQPALVSTKAPIFDLGQWHHAITTASPEAQRYFDQGLNLTYGFNHAQAIVAYEQAARLDPNCAMAYWGKALALGPNINMPMDSTAEAPAWEALQRAVALAPKASEGERAYIEALATRYGDPRGAHRPSRAAMDSAYANAMRELWKRTPNDADAGTLFAEAMLDLSPWNQWGPDGKALPGTDEIVVTLESVLKMSPDCPGANHYYIHAVEASRHPERAVPAAERLGNLVPDAGHLVHMPGHIWHRVGRYAESEDANVRAARVDSIYVATHKPEGIYPMMYYPHNVHFIWSSACFDGHSAAAIQAARRLETMWSVEMVRQMAPIEFVCPTTMYTFVRFGRWDDLLKQPAPPAELRFTTGMWHYARGLAFAATGRLPDAMAERESLAAIATATPPEAPVGYNSATAILSVAQHALAGEIAAKQGRTDEAVKELRDGVKEEDGLHYDEPPDWYLPVRQQLGAVLLVAGRAAEAEAVYREDLEHFRENGWSLFGLAQCLRARKADAEAAAVEKRFARAWARADVKLKASRF
jgi:tetratricopeptide (TPR) repeat protein